MGKRCRIRPGAHFGNDHQRTAGQRLADGKAVRQRHHRIGAHNPHRFHLTAANGGKQVHRRQSRRLRQPFAAPKARQSVQILRLKIHMGGQHRRQAAHLAAAHRIWLSGQRKRPAARTPVLPAGEVDVNNGITLVATAGRLIDPHGVERYRPRRSDEITIEPGDLLHVQPAEFGHLCRVPGCSGGQRLRLVAKIARQRTGLGNGAQ